MISKNCYSFVEKCFSFNWVILEIFFDLNILAFFLLLPQTNQNFFTIIWHLQLKEHQINLICNVYLKMSNYHGWTNNLLIFSFKVRNPKLCQIIYDRQQDGFPVNIAYCWRSLHSMTASKHFWYSIFALVSFK